MWLIGRRRRGRGLSGVGFLLVTTLGVVMQAGRSASLAARSAGAALRRSGGPLARNEHRHWLMKKSTPERG